MGLLAGGAEAVERVLRERTDVFERERAIVAVAVGTELAATLAGSAVGGARHVESADDAGQLLDSETVDLAIAPAGAIAASAELRELRRILRPGGRLVVPVQSGAAAPCARRLAGAGFLVLRATEDGGAVTVLIAVRGEFAAYAA